VTRVALGVGAVVLVAAAAVFPWFAGNYPVKLLDEILIWGVFAMSLDLLMGYTGMVSFGHSAFFGIGSYAAALALKQSPGLLSALLVPAVAAGLGALVIGFFSIRVGGVYFIMLTLAFSQMFWAYTVQAGWLGAEDGVIGIPRARALGIDLGAREPFHLFVVAVATIAAVVLWRVVRSPFGHVLRGIHENEGRMEAVGYAVNRYKLLAFVISGSIAGAAGALYAQLNGQAPPDAFFWTTSGEALLMVIIGGTGTLGGPVLGAAAFILFQSLVSSYTERWMLILGAAFIVFVLFAPGGIVGTLGRRLAPLGRRLGPLGRRPARRPTA
jgi:branched-chain amino acid transport system permease protein